MHSKNNVFFSSQCDSSGWVGSLFSLVNNIFVFFRLMPIIEGGTYRVWSRTQDLQLSAEQSYDPNMDPDNQSLLHYHWECQGTSKVSHGLLNGVDANLKGMKVMF